MFPKGESIESELTEGAIWLNDDLIASFSFPIIKSEENYQTESLAAEESVYPVFLNNKTNVTKSIDSLQDHYTPSHTDYLANVAGEWLEGFSAVEGTLWGRIIAS